MSTDRCFDGCSSTVVDEAVRTKVDDDLGWHVAFRLDTNARVLSLNGGKTRIM